MALIQQMLVPFMVILLIMNTMAMFTYSLPSNVTGTSTYGDSNKLFDASQAQDLNNSFNDILQDYNKAIDTNVSVTATTQQRGLFDILGGLIYGVARSTVSVIVGEEAAEALDQLASFISLMLKYILGVFFGYWTWIDYFIPSIGALAFIGFLFKIVFFVIQATGFITIVLPIFTGGRQT